MFRRSRSLGCLILYLFLVAQSAFADVTVNPAVTYQTIDGWEGDVQMGQGSPNFNFFKDALIDKVVNDLGITRVRLGISNSVENTHDYWSDLQNGLITRPQWKCYGVSTVNDNSDPFSINPAGFTWTRFDENIDKVVLPLRQKIAANGEALWVNLTYVAFTNGLLNTACSGLNLHTDHTSADEYAEFVLAAFLHMQSKYGFVPDSFELYLEPDNVSYPVVWDGTRLGQALVATQARLSANGFHPKFVAPSTTSMANASVYFDQLAAVPGALQHLSEISYHRYVGVSPSALQQIATRAAQHNKKTSQLEWIGASHDTLHEDLKIGMNSSWTQFVLGYSECAEAPIFPCGNYSNPPGPADDNGAQYYLVDDSSSNYTIYTGSRTKLLRQYMKYIRPGAVRIGATTTNSNLDPLAFINRNNKYVVVILTNQTSVPNAIFGLPAGTYGRSYTTLTQNPVDLPDVTITAGQSVQIPALSEWGAVTVYAKSTTSGVPCDLNSDSSTNVQDVQLCANQAVGVSLCSTGDIDRNGSCNVIDVQRVVNNALGGACVSP